MGWAIALHGGAGDIPLNLPPERREPREAALRHCLDIGVAALKHNKSPLDVVELVVSLSLSLIFFCNRGCPGPTQAHIELFFTAVVAPKSY